MAAAVATHTALLQQHRLAPGELGYVLVLNPTTLQSRIIFGYAKGFIETSPVLRSEIAGMTANEIRLRNRVVIATHRNSFRTVRGRTLLAVIFDKSAFWRDKTTTNPDIETVCAQPSQRATWPPRATVRQRSIALITFIWSRLTCPKHLRFRSTHRHHAMGEITDRDGPKPTDRCQQEISRPQCVRRPNEVACICTPSRAATCGRMRRCNQGHASAQRLSR